MKRFLPALSVFLFACTIIRAQSFTSSNLPVVVISTNSQNIDNAQQPVVVQMGVIRNLTGRNNLSDPFNNFNGLVRIKIHGSSTVMFPKKSFSVTTLDAQQQESDVSLMGYPPEHDWVFKALYQDKTFLRDDIAFLIFREMGHYSSHSQFFELVVDGDYRGVYELEEKIKRDPFRVDISRLKSTDLSGNPLSGGYIIKLDKYQQGDPGWYSNYNSNVTQDSANYFLFVYPKPDSMPQEQKDYIRNFFDRFENALASPAFADPDSGYARYINITSFIDNFLLNELSRNVDGYRCSTYFYKDQDVRGDQKLHCGPVWDFNIAWDNCYYNGGNNPAGWQYQQFATVNFVPFWWWQILSDTNFTNELKCRYTSLRNTVLNENALYAYIDSMALVLDESQQRNFVRWPIMGQVVWPNPSPVPPDYAGEIARLKNWIQQRFAWLDANIPGDCRTAPVPSPPSFSGTLQGCPNPFVNDFSFTYNVPEDGTVKIELFGMEGTKVLDIYDGTKAAGTYTNNIMLPQLASGIYVLRLSVDGREYYSRVSKID